VHFAREIEGVAASSARAPMPTKGVSYVEPYTGKRSKRGYHSNLCKPDGSHYHHIIIILLTKYFSSNYLTKKVSGAAFKRAVPDKKK